MLTNVPGQSDFEKAAIARLNLAWEAASSLMNLIRTSELELWDEDGSAKGEFWRASQQSLGNAHALIHQGIELLLKGHIAAVSPYLLLSRRIQDWPTRRPTWTADFSDFHTVDAADLVKLFNTVCPHPLSDSFSSTIEIHRKERNAFIHSLGSAKLHEAFELWKVILEVVHNLVAPRSWFSHRRAYAELDSRVIAYGSDFVLSDLAQDAEMLLGGLNDMERERYLGWQTKAQSYICYYCATDNADADIRPQTAQLIQTDPNGNELTCFTCSQTIIADRQMCENPTCEGDVIGPDGLCLTCFSHQS